MIALDEIRERVEAAEPGPWYFKHCTPCTESGHRDAQLWGRGGNAMIAHWGDEEPLEEADAEFIAHARMDIPRLIAALDAVTKLHYQREDAEEVIPWSCMDGPCEHDDDCPEVSIRSCDECSTPEYLVQWPCPTVRALTEALA